MEEEYPKLAISYANTTRNANSGNTEGNNKKRPRRTLVDEVAEKEEKIRTAKEKVEREEEERKKKEEERKEKEREERCTERNGVALINEHKTSHWEKECEVQRNTVKKLNGLINNVINENIKKKSPVHKNLISILRTERLKIMAKNNKEEMKKRKEKLTETEEMEEVESTVEEEEVGFNLYG